MKAIVPADLEKRGQDSWGSGAFGASRGDRKHNGVDYKVPAGSAVLSPVEGLVTKLGYPYGNDLSFRYVQITTPEGYDHRIFYVNPLVQDGDKVKKDQIIGLAQDLTTRYVGIVQHLHYEIRHKGEYLNPGEVV